MSSLLRAQGLIVLIGTLSCGCASHSGSFLPASQPPAEPAGSETPAVQALTGQDQVAFASSRSGSVAGYSDVEPVSSTDVIRWTVRGLREEIILDRIQRSGSVFHLTAADENHLRDRGVSETVIQEMKATARR